MDRRETGPGAVIGRGRMGAGMAQNLLRGDFELRGHDVDLKIADRFEGSGRFARDAAQATRNARFLMLVVRNAAQVEDVLFAGGALDALAPW